MVDIVEATVNPEEWALRLNRDLTAAKDRIAALEAQLAETKISERRYKLRSDLSERGILKHSAAWDAEMLRLEATPPAPEVTECERAKREAIDLLLQADDAWADYGSGFRVHFSFNVGSGKMEVVERINTARALTAALSGDAS